jgi:hypothetical protein
MIAKVQTLAKSMVSYFKEKPKNVKAPIELKEKKIQSYKEKKQQIA